MRQISGEQMGNGLVNVKQVAVYLRMEKASVYHLVSQKRIPCIRLSSRCLRFRVSDIDDWLAQKVVTPKP
jgi:excisionase family DNA binding protein